MTMLDQCGITLITTAGSGHLRGYDPVTQYIKEAMYDKLCFPETGRQSVPKP